MPPSCSHAAQRELPQRDEKLYFEVFSPPSSPSFSQGGDSGSVVVDEDGFVGGLLFAGGNGVMIVNRISHVVSLLGIRM